MKKLFFIILSLAIFAACERKIDQLTVDPGAANFSKYIAVGDNMMAGFADGALYHTGQKFSIPNIIAGQLALAGSGDFFQPVVASDYGIEFPFPTMPKLKLGYRVDCEGVQFMGPVADIGARDPFQPVGYAVNNLSIPGAKSYHMIAPGYGNPAGLMPPVTANPYYIRFCTEPANPNFMVINEIPKLTPTFFTSWLGDNDVFSYAMSGGVGDSITSVPVFGAVMQAVVGSLATTGAKGVIANIPDITSIPYFTTVPYNGIVLTRQTLVDSINYFMANAFGLPQLVYKLGQNPFLVDDPTSTHPVFKVRFMQPGEMVLLSVPQDSLKCGGMGIISRYRQVPFPIPSQFVLTQDEITAIQTATAGYNEVLSGLADVLYLGLVDMNARFKELQKGIVWDGVKMNSAFVTGGAFSLDGIHLNPRGCAVVANYFIDAINNQYASTIPHVDITQYKGVTFP